MSQGRVKGTIFAEVVKFLRSRKEESRELVPEPLRHYLEKRILPTSWQPEEDYLELMKVVVKMRSKPGDDPVQVFERVARETNKAYFEGPYKALIRVGDPGASLRNFKRLWELRHDTGKVTVSVAEGRGRVELRDYSLTSAEACAGVQGTLWGMVSYSGATKIGIVHSQCRAHGAPTCVWDLAWQSS